MTMVKVIEFETYHFEKDENGNRQYVENKWVVPNSDLAYFAITEKKNVRDIHTARYFDFQMAKVARIPSWLASDMVSVYIDEYKEEYRENYETEMNNGYGTIHAENEMVGDY